MKNPKTIIASDDNWPLMTMPQVRSLQRRHEEAVLASISYENSLADVPPSLAGNEALKVCGKAIAPPLLLTEEEFIEQTAKRMFCLKKH